MGKKIIKFDDTEIEGYKFHQNKRPIAINDINTNKMVVSNEHPFGKQDLNISLVTNILKKIDLYPYSVHKWLYIKKNLMKINVFLF